MSRRVSCHCDAPSLEEIKTEGGATLGTICRICGLPQAMLCPVCRGEFRDVSAHLKATLDRQPMCGRHRKDHRKWGDNFLGVTLAPQKRVEQLTLKPVSDDEEPA
jgi:hypothetical protein